MAVVVGLATTALSASDEQAPQSTGIVVADTKLSFDPKTCTEGVAGFPWGLGSVQVTIVGHQDEDCVFDYRWEVEGAGNYQVDRVRVPIDSGLVVIDAGKRQEDRKHHWSVVYTSFTAEQARLVRRMQFGRFEVPVGKEFVGYDPFREGDEAPPIKRGDKLTVRFLLYLDEKFFNTAGPQWHRQRVTTSLGDGGEWQWVQSLALDMMPYEIRRVRVPTKIAGPAARWLPGYDNNSTIYAEMQLVEVERK